jgi:rhodanese-related sulfurtransferase
VDIRPAAEIHAIDRMIPGSVARSSDQVEHWWRSLPAGRSIVVCDLGGGAASEAVACILRGFGTNACILGDGFVGWFERGLPTRSIPRVNTDRWVTRERPKIDRIACPWLLSRFINPLAEFIYVSPGQVLETAARQDATPYDIKGVQFAHEDERCSFDAILRAFDLRIHALDRLADIVRGADTSRHDLAAQCSGLAAISSGLSANFSDDHEMLRHGMVVYDALYVWCRNTVAAPRDAIAIAHT